MAHRGPRAEGGYLDPGPCHLPANLPCSLSPAEGAMPGDPDSPRAPRGIHAGHPCSADGLWDGRGGGGLGLRGKHTGRPGSVATRRVPGMHLAEIQSKRQERKRRSTANPTYSGLLETEVRPPRCGRGSRLASLGGPAGVGAGAAVPCPSPGPEPAERPGDGKVACGPHVGGWVPRLLGSSPDNQASLLVTAVGSDTLELSPRLEAVVLGPQSWGQPSGVE